MRLRKPCEHGKHDEHIVRIGVWPGWTFCPGGEFLTEDALVIERVAGEWPEWAHEAVLDARLPRDRKRTQILLDALTVRDQT